MSRELRFVRDEIILADGRRVGETLDADRWIEEDLLGRVFERDASGLPRFRLVYEEFPRGHWKSGGAGAIALAETFLHDSTDVVVAAADRDQAAIVLECIEGFLQRNAGLQRAFKRKGDEFQHRARRSRIRVISSDVASSWGLGGSHRRFRVIADELTAWPGERGEQLWTSLSSATGKVADAQSLILSNAGFDSAHSWQFRVREVAADAEWALLVTTDGPIASWIDDAWIEQQRSILPGPAFDRLILNAWTSQSGDFVTRDQWRRCVDPGLCPQIEGIREVAYFGGHDLGVRKDATAFAIVHLKPLDGYTIELDELQVRQGSAREPLDISAEERYLADAKRRYPRLQIWADRWNFESVIRDLVRSGVAIVDVPFTSGSIAKLSSALYSVISDASLRVFDDPQLEEEILSLQTVQTAAGWRLDHRAGGYSDRAIALGLAVQQALQHRRSGSNRGWIQSGRIQDFRSLQF